MKTMKNKCQIVVETVLEIYPIERILSRVGSFSKHILSLNFKSFPFIKTTKLKHEYREICEVAKMGCSLCNTGGFEP